MNIPHFPTARKANLVIQEVPNEVLVYDLDNNKAHCLNHTAALVWNACNGSRSVPEIAQIIGLEAGSEIPDELVWLAIDQLNESDLLERQIQSELAGSSRREAIKKLGLASMIALPIVASLVAPQSVLANVSCSCSALDTPPTLQCTNRPPCPTNSCSGGFCI